MAAECKVLNYLYSGKALAGCCHSKWKGGRSKEKSVHTADTVRIPALDGQRPEVLSGTLCGAVVKHLHLYYYYFLCPFNVTILFHSEEDKRAQMYRQISLQIS